MGEPPLMVLERWELHGAPWRLAWRSRDEVAVDLLSCTGEPMEQLRSSDPELRRYLELRPSSESDRPETGAEAGHGSS